MATSDFWICGSILRSPLWIAQAIPRIRELRMSTALVTGSNGGIGAATAALLAAEGHDVVVTGRDADRGAAVVEQITADGGNARFVAADLHDLDSLRALAASAGPVEVLINNAGAFPGAPLVAQDVESYESAFALNVRAPYFLSAALVPGMIERGRGSIVNVSTMAASVGMPGLSTYGATKAALESLTRTWAAELGGSGIRVNAVAPGPTGTEMFLSSMDTATQSAIAASTILGRVADPQEIARVITFVATDAGSYLTGAVIAADAGRTAI
jgi:NAD(P)-dependent dehydrogenase (short-subunit alcohol dehydrogenase family)